MNITLILLGLYLLLVAKAGNAQQLIADAGQDKEFLVWLIAVAVLYAISRIPDATGIANVLIALALMALLINSIGTVSSQWSQIYAMLMASTTTTVAPVTGG